MHYNPSAGVSPNRQLSRVLKMIFSHCRTGKHDKLSLQKVSYPPSAISTYRHLSNVKTDLVQHHLFPLMLLMFFICGPNKILPQQLLQLLVLDAHCQ